MTMITRIRSSGLEPVIVQLGEMVNWWTTRSSHHIYRCVHLDHPTLYDIHPRVSPFHSPLHARQKEKELSADPGSERPTMRVLIDEGEAPLAFLCAHSRAILIGSRQLCDEMTNESWAVHELRGGGYYRRLGARCYMRLGKMWRWRSSMELWAVW